MTRCVPECRLVLVSEEEMVETTTYQLWDNASGNLIEDYDTEREALLYVREEIETYGSDVARSWALLCDSGIGAVIMVAQGMGLIHRARQSAP